MSSQIESDKEAHGIVGCVTLLCLPLLLIWDGFVLSILWRWFISAPFHLPEIKIAQAIGISIIVALVTATRQAKDEDIWWIPAIGVIKPAGLLLIGWIVHFWM